MNAKARSFAQKLLSGTDGTVRPCALKLSISACAGREREKENVSKILYIVQKVQIPSCEWN